MYCVCPPSNPECNAGVRQRRIVETACMRNETHLEKSCAERTKTASQATENEDEKRGGKLVRHCKNRSWKPSSMERNCSRHQYGGQWIAMSAKALQRQDKDPDFLFPQSADTQHSILKLILVYDKDSTALK